MQVKDLIVTGDARILGNLYANGGSISGGSGGSSSDGSGLTYTLSKSGSTITLTGSDGSTSSVTDSNTDTNTTYSAATSSALGLVKIGSNITNSSGTISLTKENVTSALGYTPPTSNTTYSAATTSAAGLMSAADKSKLDGITASADTVSFSRSLSSGTKIGTITINGTGTDLYCQTNTDTNTTYSAGTGISLSGTTFSNSGVRSIATGSSNGTISVNTNGTTANVAVKGLGSAAYTASTAYAAASHTHSGYAASSHTHSASDVDLSSFRVYAGQKSGTTLAANATAEGIDTTATGTFGSHAEGYNTTASGMCSHAEGFDNIASGYFSHAEGSGTTASGKASHTEGVNTTANENQHVQGHYNDSSLATAGSTTGGTSGTAFVIGNGTSSAASNACRITYAGAVIGKAAYASTGADYAEYFEWEDGNVNCEDRVGYFVTFADGKYIKKANEGDYILGIVSGNPCVLGNHDECWMGKNEMDEWGRFIYVTETVTDEITGETYEYQTYKVNPDYDNNMQYIPRADRPEWSAVGMIGVLAVRDDGTCQVNGYCKVMEGGIATTSDTGYRVIERVANNIVKVVFR